MLANDGCTHQCVVYIGNILQVSVNGTIVDVYLGNMILTFLMCVFFLIRSFSFISSMLIRSFLVMVSSFNRSLSLITSSRFLETVLSSASMLLFSRITCFVVSDMCALMYSWYSTANVPICSSILLFNLQEYSTAQWCSQHIPCRL